MFKLVLDAHNAGVMPLSGAFVRHFQEATLLLLKKRGVLTETQLRDCMRRVAEAYR